MMEIQIPALTMVTKKTMGTELPLAPDGAQLHLMVTATSNGVVATSMMAMMLPKAEGPIVLTVECVQHNFPPPPPPETDDQRRRRLITEVLDHAREAGRPGLTTDDQENTVNDLMAVLDGEFADEDMSDVNPNNDDPRDVDWSTDSQRED